MKNSTPNDTQIIRDIADITYIRLVHGKNKISPFKNLLNSFEKINQDFNNGTAGTGRIYDHDTGIVWSIVALTQNQYDNGFVNKVIREHYPEFD